MSENKNDTSTSKIEPTSTSRRKFVAGATAVGAAASALPVQSFANVAGSDQVKVGLIGVGGRGSGAIVQNLTGNDKAVFHSVADAFGDKIDGTGPRARGIPQIQKTLEESGKGGQMDVPAERQHAGFDAYKAVIDEVDVVCIATPPGFRPIHFDYAIQQGTHVFMEKPVCVDAKGYNTVINAAKLADEKGLKCVVGLQRHYQGVYEAAFEKVHKEGLIGEIVSAQCWWNTQRPWIVARQDGWTEMEYQMRNWYHFNWLCGDHIAEQHVHNLDIVNWFVSGDSEKGGNPISVQGMGGRQGTEPKSVGEIFDHHYCEFRYGPEYNNAIMNSQCRHIKGTWRQVAEEIHGTEGILYLGQGKITNRKGETIWQYRKPRGEANPYQVEHDRLHDAIINDKPLNNAYYGAKSSFTAVLGRMATYSGQNITWDEAVESDFSILPEEFDMNAEPPVKPDGNGDYYVAIPGEYKLPWK